MTKRKTKTKRMTLDEQSQGVIDYQKPKLIQRAFLLALDKKSPDKRLMGTLLSKLLPPAKPEPVKIDIRAKTMEASLKKLEEVIATTGINPQHLTQILALLKLKSDVTELEDLRERLDALESKTR